MAELGVQVLPMSFNLNGSDYKNYPDNRELAPHDFYDALRAGGVSTTSQINQVAFTEAFEPVLESGRDVLYLAFSSGLSGTCHSAVLAAEELREKYPGRTVEVIDTLQASMGEGLAVYYAASLKNQGKPLAEVADWFKANKMRVCAWFTVDDLMFLKRGGAPVWRRRRSGHPLGHQTRPACGRRGPSGGHGKGARAQGQPGRPGKTLRKQRRTPG